MKYVIHLGVHNTASTLLQRNLHENLEALRAQGVFYVNAEMPGPLRRQTRMLRRLNRPNSVPAPRDEFLRINTAFAKRAEAAGAQTVLISDEDRLGEPMQQLLAQGASNPGFYADAAKCLDLALTGIPADQTRLLLYTRNPESYLVSLYSEAIRLAQTTLTLEGFCRAVNFNAIDFGALEATLRDTAPTAEVKSRQFERIKLGPETYWRSFLRDIGLDPKPFTLHDAPLPPLLDATQVEALLHIMAGNKSKRWRMVKKLRDQVISGAPNPLAPLTLPPWVSESMRVTAEGRATDARTSVA